MAINYLSLLLALFLTACIPLQSSKSTHTSPEIHVKTDLITLENRINLPQKVSSVQWIVLPRGIASRYVPGPTDTILYAVLKSKNDDWSSLPEAKPLLTSEKVVNVPVNVAEKLFSPDILKDFHQVDGYLQITGKQYEPSFFNKSSYRGVYAILVRDRLLVCLQSM
ncbi:MAG TPA: hypothetical protein V6D50_15330 [Chroococcales cyanobacterium]|jgi:hypothetical protein